MDRWDVVMKVRAALSVVVGPAVALVAPQTYGNAGKRGMIDYCSMEGKVTALDPNSETIQVKPTDGSMSGPVRVAVSDQTVIHDGILHRSAAHLKIGEDVNLWYSGSGNTWVADNNNILDPSVPIAHYPGSGARLESLTTDGAQSREFADVRLLIGLAQVRGANLHCALPGWAARCSLSAGAGTPMVRLVAS